MVKVANSNALCRGNFPAFCQIRIMPVLIESQFFPPIESIARMLQDGEVVIDAHEKYVRRSYRNRCHIAGPNGMLRLSVPLIGGKSERLPTREKRISYEEDWQKLHWMSLCSCYRRSPYFEYYEDKLFPLFEQRYETIIELGVETLKWVNTQLNLGLHIRLSKSDEPGFEKMTNLRSKINPLKDNDLGGYKDPVYHQVFENKLAFIPGLSILDLIFAEGPQAKQRLVETTVEK